MQSIRSERLRRHSLAQGTFRTYIGPLYFERIDLLMQYATALEMRPEDAGFPVYEWYLEQARLTFEHFKIC